MNAVFVMYGKEVLGLEAEWKQIPGLVDRAGRLKTNSVVAYLYQTWERELMSGLIEKVEESQILLTVHDCIYTRYPIKLVEAREYLKAQGEFFDITHEEHHPWAFDHDIIEHKKRIAEEEKRAAALCGTHTLPGKRYIKFEEFDGNKNAYDEQLDSDELME